MLTSWANFEFGHFRLLFYGERQRNLPKFITHVQVIVLLILTENLPDCLVTLSLPSPSRVLRVHSLDLEFCFTLSYAYNEHIKPNLTSSFDSSVGRAEDCRANEVILRSLVRIRLEGLFFLSLVISYRVA